MSNDPITTNTWVYIVESRHFYPWKKGKLVKVDKKGYILDVDVEYAKELHKNNSDPPFPLERMKIGKVEKLVSNLNYKKRYVVHITSLDQELKHGLRLKKVHRVIRFKRN